jgi:D-amino-acid dehydrogenase
MDEGRARLLLRQVQDMLPGVNTAGAQFWMGHRPSFPDSLPVIDRMPGCPSLLLAFGNGHTGMTGAPMTGRLVADLLAERPPAIDPSPFRVDRF